MNYRTADNKRHKYNPDASRQKEQQELASNINYKKAQLAASDANYKNANDNRPAFSKMDYIPNSKQAVDVAKHCSDSNYRSVDHKGINFETAEMRKAREAQDIASSLTYKQDNCKYTFTNEDKHLAHLRKQKDIASDLKYKQGGATKFTAGAERSDLKHLSEIKNLSSNHAYKQDAGYTFCIDTPAMEHAKKAKILSSDNEYKKQHQSGSGWFPEEALAYQHYNEAQSMLHKKDYQKDAKKAMPSGGALQVSSIEEYPFLKHAGAASELISDVNYKQNHKTMYNPLDTPGMEHVRFAEKIKSGSEYKKEYETDVYGRAAITFLDTPEMEHARNTRGLNSDRKYKEKYERELKGRAMASLDTPEMKRLREAKKNISNISYKLESESPIILQQKPLVNNMNFLDTPEYNRIKNATKNTSDKGYRSKTSGGMAGGLDMRTIRAMQLSKIQSDAKYKDVTSVKEKHDQKRMRAVNAQEIVQYDQPVQKRQRAGKRSPTKKSHAKRSEESGMETGYASNASQAVDDFTYNRKYKSYRANPGSIMDYDPTDIDEAEDRRRTRPSNKKAFEQDEESQADEDFNLLSQYQSNPSLRNDNTNTRSWMDYLQGEYKSVAPANHIDRQRDVLGEATTLINISKEQCNRAREAAFYAAKQDEQQNIAGMYAKQHETKVRECSENMEQSVKKQSKEVRLNLSSYGYTTDYTDYSESGYDQADASATCDSALESEESVKINTFMAMYPYAAQEEDELTFSEGDYLDECQFIGEGWLYGYNRRTGESGMLPANYVESVNI